MSASDNLKYVTKLSKKRVLIFGGTSGIGFCVAEAALEHGASVILSGSNPDKLSKAIDRLKTAYPSFAAENVSGYTCDLSQSEGLETNLETLFKSATSGGSRPLDHITFTAGDALKVTHVSEASVDFIQKVGVVRFVAPLVLAKVAPKYLVPGPSSSITLTGGTNSSKPSPGWAIMAGWGAGIEGIARGLAVDLKPIRVNLVSPGAVHTELFDSIPAEMLEGFLKQAREATLTGEVGKPEHLAEAYIYAMKDHFISGTVISSDGGRLLA
ncbi:MAG: hypothetical protein M1837_002886 [Sclerophora amabilis]|nr:MAG: hypothetical protein M1837_002886 [Sclerophora amabilis]